jgi:hypothetical protein
MLRERSILRPQRPILLSEPLARRSRPLQPAQQLLRSLADSVQILPQAERLGVPCAGLDRHRGRGGCGSVQRGSAASVAVGPALRVVRIRRGGTRLTGAVAGVSARCIAGSDPFIVGNDRIFSSIAM